MGRGTQKALWGSGKSSQTVVNQPNPPTEEELQLIRINTDLANRQLQNMDALAPFEKELLDLSLADLRRSSAEGMALDAAITPEQRAAQAKSDFERNARLGPIQDQILEMQMANMRGELTPGQRAAADAAIKAAHGDIDIATQEGIGLIADELANSRGLRLTDSPIMREAGILAEAGLKQKSSAAANIRASSMLQMPQISSGIGLQQQSLAQASQQFQDQLRNQAYQNRLALTGGAGSFGIGLANIGSGVGASSLSSLTDARGGRRDTSGFDPNARMAAAGQMMQGIGSIMGGAMKSDRRVKNDYGVVGKTDGGIDLHLFHYKWEDERDPLRLGVMAQDVEKVNPRAVGTDRSGVKYVNYARL